MLKTTKLKIMNDFPKIQGRIWGGNCPPTFQNLFDFCENVHEYFNKHNDDVIPNATTISKLGKMQLVAARLLHFLSSY